MQPRQYAESILCGELSIEEVPSNLLAMVKDHLESHRFIVEAYSQKIWNLPNGHERHIMFNKLKAKNLFIAEAVSKRVKELKEQSR